MAIDNNFIFFLLIYFSRKITDSGGIGENYGINENYLINILPTNYNYKIHLKFNNFKLAVNN